MINEPLLCRPRLPLFVTLLFLPNESPRNVAANRGARKAVSDYQTDQVVFWISIAVNVAALVVLFLKSRYAVMILSIAAAFLSPVATYGTHWHHITVPLRWWPLLAIFRLAKPSSRWKAGFTYENARS